jgi:hypothetical protein
MLLISATAFISSSNVNANEGSSGKFYLLAVTLSNSYPIYLTFTTFSLEWLLQIHIYMYYILYYVYILYIYIIWLLQIYILYIYIIYIYVIYRESQFFQIFLDPVKRCTYLIFMVVEFEFRTS